MLKSIHLGGIIGSKAQAYVHNREIRILQTQIIIVKTGSPNKNVK